MNQNGKRLIEVLNSGEYTQARKQLRDGDSYCCLGLICDLYMRCTGEGRWVETGNYWTFELPQPDGRYAIGETVFPDNEELLDKLDDDGFTGTHVLPAKVAEWIGMSRQNICGSQDVCGEYKNGDKVSSLALDNDDGASFAEIAETIIEYGILE